VPAEVRARVFSSVDEENESFIRSGQLELGRFGSPIFRVAYQQERSVSTSVRTSAPTTFGLNETSRIATHGILWVCAYNRTLSLHGST
jgi:hypothetical protein